MPPANRLPSDLVEAYRRTRFQVDDPEGRFTVTVDVYSEELALCHKHNQVDSSAFITAWNPGSRECSDAENSKAEMDLINLVKELGYRWIPGVGMDPAEKWQGERSLLILGIKEKEAKELGRRFGQNAIIVNDSSAVPGLCFP